MEKEPRMEVSRDGFRLYLTIALPLTVFFLIVLGVYNCMDSGHNPTGRTGPQEHDETSLAGEELAPKRSRELYTQAGRALLRNAWQRRRLRGSVGLETRLPA